MGTAKLTPRLFAARLNEAIDTVGISGKALAARVGTTANSISRYRKARSLPAPPMQRLLEHTLGLPDRAFLADADGWTVAIKSLNTPATPSTAQDWERRVADVRAAAWERFAALERARQYLTPGEGMLWMERLSDAFMSAFEEGAPPPRRAPVPDAVTLREGAALADRTQAAKRQPRDQGSQRA